MSCTLQKSNVVGTRNSRKEGRNEKIEKVDNHRIAKAASRPPEPETEPQSQSEERRQPGHSGLRTLADCGYHLSGWPARLLWAPGSLLLSKAVIGCTLVRLVLTGHSVMLPLVLGSISISDDLRQTPLENGPA